MLRFRAGTFPSLNGGDNKVHASLPRTQLGTPGTGKALTFSLPNSFSSVLFSSSSDIFRLSLQEWRWPNSSTNLAVRLYASPRPGPDTMYCTSLFRSPSIAVSAAMTLAARAGAGAGANTGALFVVTRSAKGGTQ